MPTRQAEYSPERHELDDDVAVSKERTTPQQALNGMGSAVLSPISFPQPNTELDKAPEAVARVLAEEVLDVSDRYGTEGERAYIELIGRLRKEPDQAARTLCSVLEQLPKEERLGRTGQRLVYALGHIGSSEAVAELRSIALENPPRLDPNSREHLASTHSDAVITSAMALQALRRIAGHSSDPATIRKVKSVMDDVLSDGNSSPHLVVTASTILLRHSHDTTRELARQSELVGAEREFLLEVRHLRESPSERF